MTNIAQMIKSANIKREEKIYGIIPDKEEL